MLTIVQVCLFTHGRIWEPGFRSAYNATEDASSSKRMDDRIRIRYQNVWSQVQQETGTREHETCNRITKLCFVTEKLTIYSSWNITTKYKSLSIYMSRIKENYDFIKEAANHLQLFICFIQVSQYKAFCRYLFENNLQMRFLGRELEALFINSYVRTFLLKISLKDTTILLGFTKNP